MKEACFCEHLDHLCWLPKDARLAVMGGADKRRPGSARYAGRRAG